MKRVNIFTVFLLVIFSISFTISSCENEDTPDTNIIEEEEKNEVIYWTGDTITFTKAADTDASLEDNQDRITDDVWLTRSSGGGKFYNAAVEVMLTLVQHLLA